MTIIVIEVVQTSQAVQSPAKGKYAGQLWKSKSLIQMTNPVFRFQV